MLSGPGRRCSSSFDAETAEDVRSRSAGRVRLRSSLTLFATGIAPSSQGDQVPRLEDGLVLETLQVVQGTLGAGRLVASDALRDPEIRPPARIDRPVIVLDPPAEVAAHYR